MIDIEQLSQQHHRTFVLVCSNFIMFLVLFFALGIVAWYSATLVSKLKGDLEKTEQAVVQLQQKIQNMNVDVLMDKVMARARENMGTSIKTAISQSDFNASLNDLGEKIENSRVNLERISQAVQRTNDALQKMDTEQLAQLVSYNMLKGLGEAFTNAAEARRPSSLAIEPEKSSVSQ